MISLRLDKILVEDLIGSTRIGKYCYTGDSYVVTLEQSKRNMATAGRSLLLCCCIGNNNYLSGKRQYKHTFVVPWKKEVHNVFDFCNFYTPLYRLLFGKWSGPPTLILWLCLYVCQFYTWPPKQKFLATTTFENVVKTIVL